MPIRSKYSNKEYEALMNDIFMVLEQHNADRDLSVMALGNVLSSIFTNEVTSKDRATMVEQFCSVLKKTTVHSRH